MKKTITIFFTLLLLSLLSFTTYAYSDVDENYQYSEAIQYATDQGIVQGYSDGTYRPGASINRAEFTKILVEAKIGENPVGYATHCFNDFSITEWFASYVCYAKMKGIVSGHPDGSFRPANNINLAEASKILVNVFELKTTEPEGSEWYSVYIETLGVEGYIPSSFEYVGDKVTRGEVVEMIFRIMEKKHDLDAIDAESLQNSPCQTLGEDLPANIDMNIVRQTWIGWYNDARQQEGLYAYLYNDQLNLSATAWTEYAKQRGYMDHKRPGQTEYYDYNMITQWFANLGITFENTYGVTYSENIGGGPYYCSVTADDCTQDLLNQMRYNLDGYMAEKDLAYKPHYNSIMNKYFKEIGLGISIDLDRKLYYLTVHYGTRITSDPLRICD